MGLMKTRQNSAEREQAQRLYGIVRDVRTEAKDFGDGLSRVRRTSEQPDLTVRTQAIVSTCAESTGVFEGIGKTSSYALKLVRFLRMETVRSTMSTATRLPTSKTYGTGLRTLGGKASLRKPTVALEVFGATAL
jgi:hypothetical protein